MGAGKKGAGPDAKTFMHEPTGRKVRCVFVPTRNQKSKDSGKVYYTSSLGGEPMSLLCETAKGLGYFGEVTQRFPGEKTQTDSQ